MVSSGRAGIGHESGTDSATVSGAAGAPGLDSSSQECSDAHLANRGSL